MDALQGGLPVAGVEEDPIGPRSPSGRWVVLSGAMDAGDYVWRSVWLFDRKDGKVFPLLGRTWPAPVEPEALDPEDTPLVVGETTIRWLDGVPERLIVGEILVVPGFGIAGLPGQVVW